MTGDYFPVFGIIAVYVVDGKDVKHANLNDAQKESTLGIWGVKIHVLAQSDLFDFSTSEPTEKRARRTRSSLIQDKINHKFFG